MQLSLPAIWSQSHWDPSTILENGAWLHWTHWSSLAPPYPHLCHQSTGICLAECPSAKNGSSATNVRDPFCCTTGTSHFTGSFLFLIYQAYESIHIKLKLFLREIRTTSRFNYELCNHSIHLELEFVQSIDPRWMGSPWTLRDWNSHLFHIQGLKGMNFRNSSSADPNPEKFFIWNYSINILSEETS